MTNSTSPLHVRWLGSVPYTDALAIQDSMFRHGTDNRLLLLEHPHVFTYGPSADLEKNLLCDPAAVGADFVAVKRGGDITYHGPGQLVGYPLLTLQGKNGNDTPPDSPAYVHAVEQVVIDALHEIGLPMRPDSVVTPVCGWMLTPQRRARYAQLVFVLAVVARCTGLPSTFILILST